MGKENQKKVKKKILKQKKQREILLCKQHDFSLLKKVKIKQRREIQLWYE